MNDALRADSAPPPSPVDSSAKRRSERAQYLDLAPVPTRLRGRIVVADDDRASRDELARLLTHEGFEVAIAEDGEQALVRIEEMCPDVLLTDLRMPGLDGLELLRRSRELYPDLITLLMTGYTGVDTCVQAMRDGAEHYLLKPLKLDELLLIVDRALAQRALRRETTELRARVKGRLRFDNIVGTSPVMQAVFDIIEQVAPSRASVLITGESGTGKELVAQAIHENSPRAHAPFVKLHCAALSESILESELFGHERGAFTGSVGRREGRFKQADGGTLFLDEVGDLSGSIQVKLLRFLQERAFERVGGNETLKVDVRVVAATNRDLAAEVSSGRFREDLFYRLNVVGVEMPSLRARPSDLFPLASHFLERFAEENGKKITGFAPEALERIAAYRWPGNVRELENAVERAVVLCTKDIILATDLPTGVGPSPKGVVRIPGSTMEEIERHAITVTLDACDGRSAQAAQMLDLSVRKIQYKMNEYGILPRRGTTTA